MIVDHLFLSLLRSLSDTLAIYVPVRRDPHETLLVHRAKVSLEIYTLCELQRAPSTMSSRAGRTPSSTASEPSGRSSRACTHPSRRSLTHLTFGLDFNQPLASGVLPAGLTHLSFGQNFNQPFGLPRSVTHLTISPKQSKLSSSYLLAVGFILVYTW